MPIYIVTAYLVAHVVATVILIDLIAYIWQRRAYPAATGFALVTLSVMGVIISVGLSIVSQTPQSAGFWLWTVRFAFLPLVAPLTLLFVLDYLGYLKRRRRLARRAGWLLFLIPAVSVALNLTNGAHHLFIRDSTFVRLGSYTVRLGWQPGPWFHIYELYTGLLFLIAAALIARRLLHTSGRLRQQYTALLAGGLLLSGLSAIDSSRLVPSLSLPVSSFGLSVMAVLLARTGRDHLLPDLLTVTCNTLADGTGELVFMLDAADRIVDINLAASRALGRPLEEVRGHSLRELMPQVFEQYPDHSPEGEIAHVEIEIPRSSGGRSYYDLSIFPIRWGEHPTGKVVVLRDITDNKRTARELRKLASAVEYSPSTVVITDSEGRIEYVNPRVTELTGYTPDELIGKTPRLFKSSQTPQAKYVELWETIKSGKTWYGEFVNRKKNGELYWEMASISPITDTEGNITHFVKVAEDITRFKKVEQELIRRQHALHTVIASMPSPLLQVDEDNRLSAFFLPPRFPPVLSLSDASIGQPLEAALPPEMEKAIVPAVSRSRRTGRPDVFSCTVTGEDGTVTYLEGRTSSVQEDGRVLIVLNDVSEQKRVEAALRDSEARLRAFIAALPDLAFIYNEDGYYVDILSPHSKDLYRPAEELSRRRVHEVLPEDAARLIHQAIRQTTASGRSQIVQYSLDLPSGRQWFEGRTALLSPPTDSTPALVVLVARNITRHKQAEETLRLQNMYLAALHETALDLARQTGQTDLLSTILVHVNNLMGVSHSVLYVVDPVQNVLVQAVGLGRYASDTGARSRRGEGASGRAWESGQMVYVADYQTYPDRQPGYEWLRTSISVPLHVAEEVVGILGIGFEEVVELSRTQLDLLERLGSLAALALYNTRLFEQTQKLAALEERQRLARDLHDAVSQTLFSTSIIAEMTLRDLRAGGDTVNVRQRVEQLLMLTRGAQAEMRTLLLELRPEALKETSLPDLLRQLCTAFTGRTGIPVALNLGPGNRPPCRNDIKIPLYRIAQEALNNIDKHARATEVTLTLQIEGDSIYLEIKDNGRGFDTTKSATGRLGLRGLRERADAIGATLTIDSAPGEGTRVAVRLQGVEEGNSV